MKPLALLLALLALLAPGCISIPDDVRRSFDPPDGKRPNNYGRLDDQGEVRPDRPTIASAQIAPVETRS
ncbi:MAG: hypothetical protein AB7N76_01485 [Planctomycetota bacterium]